MTSMVSLTEILYRNTRKVNAISHISTICKITVISLFTSLSKKETARCVTPDSFFLIFLRA